MMLTIDDFSRRGRAVARAPRHAAGLLVSMRATLPLMCLALAFAAPRGTAAARTAASAPAGRATLAADLRRALDQTAATSPRIPGLLLRVEAPRLGLSWSGAAGLAARATGRRLAPGAAVRVASVTKTFTAAAVLRLAERGRLALDAPIARYLPATYTMLLTHGGYRPDRITVRQLLQQTSGLFDYAETDAYDAAVRAAPAHRWTRLEQVRFALTHGRPYGPPGAAYHYSDTGYILLGAIIERVSDKPLAAAYRSLLRFDRLGLTHTYLETLEPAPPGEPPRAHQYYAGLDLARVDASFDLYGGGGLVSTMADLARFYRALLRGRVLDRPATLRMMLAIPATNTDDANGAGAGYGMGIFRITAGSVACWGHDGAWGTFAFHCPALDLTVAASSNTGDVDLDERAFLTRIVRLMRAADSGPGRGMIRVGVAGMSPSGDRGTAAQTGGAHGAAQQASVRRQRRSDRSPAPRPLAADPCAGPSALLSPPDGPAPLIIHLPLDHDRRLGSAVPFDQPERKIKPRRHPARCDEVTIINHTGVNDLGAGRPHLLDGVVVRRRGPAGDQARGRYEHSARANGRDSRPRGVDARDGGWEVAASRLRPRAARGAVVPSAAGHDQEVRTVVHPEAPLNAHGEAMRGHHRRGAIERDHLHPQRRAQRHRIAQHLERSDRIQFIEPSKDDYVYLHHRIIPRGAARQRLLCRSKRIYREYRARTTRRQGQTTDDVCHNRRETGEG